MDVVGVHGIAQQYQGPSTLAGRWRAALDDGLWCAGAGPEQSPTLSMAFYGHLFRPDPELVADGTKGASGEADALAGLDADEADEIDASAREVLGDAELAELEPDKGRARTPLRVQSVLRALDRRFGAASGILSIGVLRQVRHYLTSSDVKERVDALVDAAIGPDCRVVVGHSLGSVIAYEYFRRRAAAGREEGPSTLVTIGSPLGLRMIRERLEPGPPAPAWVAVRDPRDPVACAGPLATWWPGVVDRLVDNGSDAHAAPHYLTSERVGEVVLAATSGRT